MIPSGTNASKGLWPSSRRGNPVTDLSYTGEPTARFTNSIVVSVTPAAYFSASCGSAGITRNRRTRPGLFRSSFKHDVQQALSFRFRGSRSRTSSSQASCMPCAGGRFVTSLIAVIHPLRWVGNSSSPAGRIPRNDLTIDHLIICVVCQYSTSRSVCAARNEWLCMAIDLLDGSRLMERQWARVA